MAPRLVVEDEESARRIIAERRARGIDGRDEVHLGAYVMAPAARVVHQRLVIRIAAALDGFAGGVSSAGVNIGHSQNYRVPDVVVLTSIEADPLWVTTGVIAAVEILSPNEQPAAKVEHYRDFKVEVYVELDPDEQTIKAVDLGPAEHADSIRTLLLEALDW